MPRKIQDEQYDNERQLRKSQAHISLKKRLKLIQLVFQQKLTIYRAAKRLKLCHPTAKFIIKSYKNGKIHEYQPPSPPLQSQPDNSQPADSPGHNPKVVVSPQISNPAPLVQNATDEAALLTGCWSSAAQQIILVPFCYYI